MSEANRLAESKDLYSQTSHVGRRRNFHDFWYRIAACPTVVKRLSFSL
jgi:hypothetical protein